MFSQTSMTNRRQFLERSMLGFGSAFLLPSLLTSCTDHIIPNPDPGPGPDLPNDELGIDWNGDIKKVVVLGIGLIPEVGDILGPIVDNLWPTSGDSPWEKMKGDVEALVNQKMADDKYATVKGNLDGLQGVTTNYLNAIHNQGDIKTWWINLRDDFALYKPNFQQATYEVVLLPLYTQFVNMYLNTLRDAATHGDQWGMAPGDQDQARQDIDTLISEAGPYVDKWILQGRQQAMALANYNMGPHGLDNDKLEPFKTVNAYNRQMTLTVQDYRDTWPFYSLTKYPNGKKGTDGNPIKVTELLPREIYSDPYGCTYVDYLGRKGTTPIPLPSPLGGAPTAFPAQIAIWSGDRVDAIEVFYPTASGPGGNDHTPRMGGPGGDTGPNGEVLTYNLNNPLTQFRVCLNKATQYPTFSIIMMLWFSDSQGNPTKPYGRNIPANLDDKGWINYPDEAVSSVYVNGNLVSQWPSDANCIVVGFKYWNSPKAALRAVRLHYITSPIEKSIADLVKAFPGVAISAGLITEELKAERLAHWAHIQEFAKK